MNKKWAQWIYTAYSLAGENIITDLLHKCVCFAKTFHVAEA